jgi:pimeloyl-ACP methyl ester carboxylesterase
LIDPGWYERYSDEELRRLYQRDPEGFRRLLAATFSEEEAREIYETLLIDAATEGIFTREPDPSLPEIVLLPGIMGSHLRGSFIARSWFNILTLPFSNLLLNLGLDPNGNDPNNLRPDGYMEMSYSKAARAWRRQGYMVHEFSYDWRLPLATSANRLADFLRARRRARPQARFALICHSMGSLVASIYSRDHADWRDYVEQAVLVGGPLGGSFAIMEMLSGEYATVVKLDQISRATSLDEIRRMGSSFPGALEMLPHPDLFGSSVEALYQPRSYAGLARPGADWLRAARRIKTDLRDSPLLGRATCLVCVDRGTSCDFITDAQGEVRRSTKATRGDATVAATSSLVSGVPAYKVDFEHGDLLKDPKVIEAVPILLRGQRPPLQAVDRSVIDIPLPATESVLESPVEREVKWEMRAAEIRERITRNGVLTSEDQRWLMSQY